MNIDLGKIGVKDYKVNRYKKVYEEKEGMRLVESHEGLFGFINNETGELQIPCIYSYAEGFSEGKALVKTACGDYEFINKEGHVVIGRLDVWDARSFHNNRALVKKGCLYQYIDEYGNDIFDSPLESGTDYNDGVAIVVPCYDQWDKDYWSKKGVRIAVDVHGKKCVTLSDGYSFTKDAMFYGGFAPVEKQDFNFDESYKPRHIRFFTLKAFVTKTGEIIKDKEEVARVRKVYEGERDKVLTPLNKPIGNRDKLIWHCSDITCFGKKIQLRAETLDDLLKQKREAFGLIEQQLMALGEDAKKLSSEAVLQRAKPKNIETEE